MVAGEENAFEETQRAGLDFALVETVIENGRHQHVVAFLQTGERTVERRKRVGERL